jgi:hypothetical protein
VALVNRILGDMTAWDVSILKGAEVWVKVAGAGELHGTIQSVKTPFADEDEDQAVNFSVFEVQLDDGQKIESKGRNISRIEPTPRPPKLFR